MFFFKRVEYSEHKKVFVFIFKCKTTKIAMLSRLWLSSCPKKARDMAAAKYGTTDQSAVSVTKYLFRREICSAGTYFTENVFCRNFLNEKFVPWSYFIGKFIPLM